ncbi:hypothetical protein MRB53_013166 [Persea americana]|uniref:Uncharacterized protein n=1 Tax=Persea americana TaxID=3435 RepID=A0ACC2K799_PERAE|nr:hypothetical protein MRB53_013166 [Persea americana]
MVGATAARNPGRLVGLGERAEARIRAKAKRAKTHKKPCCNIVWNENLHATSNRHIIAFPFFNNGGEVTTERGKEEAAPCRVAGHQGNKHDKRGLLGGGIQELQSEEGKKPPIIENNFLLFTPLIRTEKCQSSLLLQVWRILRLHGRPCLLQW